jgi:4-amino-4-deoxy-L-arabinose transferase-like glycosyltransferase
VGFFPWTVIVVQAVARNMAALAKRAENRRDELFLALWFWAIFLFFSASNSKLIPYVTPIVVPLAVLAGRYVAEALESGATSLRWALWALTGIAGALAIAAVVVAIFHARLFDGETAADMASVAPVLPWLALGASLAAAALVWGLRRSTRTALIVAGIAGAVFLQGVDVTMAGQQPRSMKPLANELNKVLSPQDEVVTFRTYPQDLPVYLNRRVSVFQWSGELDFGRQWEDTSAWMFDDPAELWRRWHGARTVYMIVPKQFESDVRAGAGERYVELTRTRRAVLIVNRTPQ